MQNAADVGQSKQFKTACSYGVNENVARAIATHGCYRARSAGTRR